MWPLYVLTGALFLWTIYHRFFHPLAKIPGPFLASITPLWLVWQSRQLRRPRVDLELHKKYDSVVRIRPNEIIFCNPDHFNEVYGAGASKRFQKSDFYDATTDSSQERNHDRLDMLSEHDMDKLHLQKRLAGPVYSVKNAKQHEHLMDSTIRRWMKRLGNSSGKPIDFHHECELMSVDMMTEVTFAEPYGAIEKGTDDGHMSSMWKLWSYWCWIGLLPWLNELDKLYAPWRVVFTRGSALNMPLFPFGIKKMGEYQKASKEARPTGIHDDFRKLEVSKPEWRPQWAMMMTMTDLGAGSDTLSWTIATIVSGIASNPSVQSKLREELHGAGLREGEPVTYDEAAKLEYLEACMHEGQRMWPNIAISLPRVVPPEGMTIDGYYVPGGYIVGMNSKQLGLSESVFGPDTHLFRPERWLEVSKEKRRDMENRNLAFGGPSRKCPGMHLAWVVMAKVIATLFVNMEVKVLNELDGKPGPGGRVWREYGSFPSKWEGFEVELSPL